MTQTEEKGITACFTLSLGTGRDALANCRRWIDLTVTFCKQTKERTIQTNFFKQATKVNGGVDL